MATAVHQDITGVLSIDGVVFTDIDEVDNTIAVGVSDIGRLGGRVRSLADAKGIPDAAFRVVEAEPIRVEPPDIQEWPTRDS